MYKLYYLIFNHPDGHFYYYVGYCASYHFPGVNYFTSSKLCNEWISSGVPHRFFYKEFDMSQRDIVEFEDLYIQSCMRKHGRYDSGAGYCLNKHFGGIGWHSTPASILSSLETRRSNGDFDSSNTDSTVYKMLSARWNPDAITRQSEYQRSFIRSLMSNGFKPGLNFNSSSEEVRAKQSATRRKLYEDGSLSRDMSHCHTPEAHARQVLSRTKTLYHLSDGFTGSFYAVTDHLHWLTRNGNPAYTTCAHWLEGSTASVPRFIREHYPMLTFTVEYK